MTPQQYLRRVTDRFDSQQAFPLSPALHCLAYVGSHSHGTYVPSTSADAIDDVDFMGVVLPPANYVVGLREFEHWTAQHEELDVVLYGLHKFVRLLCKGNPNVIGLLWLRDEDYLSQSDTFKRLKENRHLFASKQVYHAFVGYAMGQMHKMTAYSPEIHAEVTTLEAELAQAGWKLSEIMDQRSLPMPQGITPYEANEKAKRLRKLRAQYHCAYMGEKRRGLVVRHGYDTKNAAHLIRLLTMGKEFVETGELQVYRTHDAEMLRAIKRGEWKLEDVKAVADDLFDNVKVAYATSPLPDRPDLDVVDTLVTEMVCDQLHLYLRGRA